MHSKLPPKILVVEPDVIAISDICNLLEKSYFDTIKAVDANSARKAAEQCLPNMVIISHRLKKNNSLQLIDNLTHLYNFPIILLVQEKMVSQYQAIATNRVKLLTVPLVNKDLIKLTRLLLKDSNQLLQDKVITYKDLSIDLSTFSVYRGNKEIRLSPQEFQILQLFITSPKKIYSRNQILEYLNNRDKAISLRTIDVQLNRIRSAIKLDSDTHFLIKTIRGVGYCLD
ncbi:MAG: winged helix-turn-helix domain-containing protein [Rickettsiaceae bacterium]